MSSEDNCDLLCDELLHEIAVGAVEGLLEESEYEDSIELEIPTTPEGSSFLEFSSYTPVMGESGYVFTTPETPLANAWGSDSFVLPSAKSFSPPNAEVTTVMLRNIPNKYTRAALLVALSDHGFDPATCNNLYLPMDTDSGCNLGYAFLNFVSHGHALEFKTRFDGCRLPSSGSRKVCSVVWANKQGLFQFSAATALGLQAAPPPPPVAVADPVAQMRYHQLPPMDSTKIFIGGLPVSTTDEDLFSYFSKFGPVKECNIIINRDTGLSRGFGFVDFGYQESVRIVDESQQRRPHVINCRVVSVRFYGAYTGPFQ
jgi:hypothetical protein